MKIVETRDNCYTTQINNKFIHSRYSPEKEADKFLKNNIKHPQTLLILGAGLGYLFKVLAEQYPHTKIISIPYNKELGDKSLELNPQKRKQWDGICDLSQFIRESINEYNLKGLQVLEWEPVTRHYTDLNKMVQDIIVKRVRLLNGNIMTTRRFGKRWLNNTIRNFLTIESYIKDFTINKPVVIIASGQSLEESITSLKTIRNSVCILSLSSASLALEYYGIKPDMVFSTDPGYYSKLHITGNEEIVVMPLTNAKKGRFHTLLLNQGNFFEEELINRSSLPHISIRENGTVAGTALEFALTYSSGKIYLLGQDLQSSDILSHIQPYAFDNLLHKDDKRTNPYYSTMYKRYINQGLSFKTYRDWFSRTGSLFPDRIKRINKNSTAIEFIEDITKEQFLKEIKTSPSTNHFNYSSTEVLPYDRRLDIVKKVLEQWIKSLDSIEIRENPLIPLIYTKEYTDDNSKTLSVIRDESEIYLKRMLIRYGRKLF